MIWRHFLFQLFNCRIIWLLELSQSCIVRAREKVGVERKNIATSFVRCAGKRTGVERKLKAGNGLRHSPIAGCASEYRHIPTLVQSILLQQFSWVLLPEESFQDFIHYNIRLFALEECDVPVVLPDVKDLLEMIT